MLWLVDLSSYCSYLLIPDIEVNSAQLHNWWIDQENYTRHTSPLYSRAMPFFSRYTGPQKIRERVRKRLRKYETSSETSSSGERLHAVYQSAQLGYEALSRKLGSNSYFFGQK